MGEPPCRPGDSVLGNFDTACSLVICPHRCGSAKVATRRLKPETLPGTLCLETLVASVPKEHLRMKGWPPWGGGGLVTSRKHGQYTEDYRAF